MIFEAVAHNSVKEVKENLDSFNELQEFMNKMVKRGFIDVMVKGTNCEGYSKIIHYSYNGIEWEQISK